MRNLLRTSKRGLKGIKADLEKIARKSALPTKLGEDLLNDPLENRGSAFGPLDRERYRLSGLLPAASFNMEKQMEVYYEEFVKGESFYSMQSDKSSTHRISPDDVRKFRFMQSLQNENETLFYKLLSENIEEMAPIVYTPTVGWFCENFSRNFRRPRGMFINKDDRGRINEVLSNWYVEDVKAIVVTDGSRILGLGDLGVGGMGISIGKTNLYVAAGGFSPKGVMPVLLDVGTNNEKLLNDPNYLGHRSRRLDGEEYLAFIDEFVACVFQKYPKVLVQFEDFEFKHASKLLNRYREEMLIFNDDIQGTAAVVMAGVLGALRVQGKSSRYITEQSFVVAGAGNAARGIISKLRDILMKFGLTEEEACRKFYIVDNSGLLTVANKNIDSFMMPFARPEPEFERLKLVDVVRKFKPTCLIGATGQGGLFTPEVLTEMNNPDSPFAPIIFPLSNPTNKSECTAEEVHRYTFGKAIFGSGSPFSDSTDKATGKVIKSNLTNNVYVYPGLAFGASLGQVKCITDNMLLVAAETVSNMLTQENIEKRMIFPELRRISEISAEIAAQIIELAAKDNSMQNPAILPYLTKKHEDLVNYVKSQQWKPDY